MKEAEEAFLTLLQRAQRQQHTTNTTSNSQSVAIPLALQQRPPDEVATAIGRQLAIKFHSIASLAQDSATSTKEEAESNLESRHGASALPVVPKGIQEKALQCLVNRQTNPAIVVSFLNTLVMSTTTTSPSYTRAERESLPVSITTPGQTHNTHHPLVQMKWLPAWIGHAESIVQEDTSSASSTAYGSNAQHAFSYHALCCMVRAFAHYSVWCHNNTIQPRKVDATLASHPQQDRLLRPNTRHQHHGDPFNIATTFRRLQTVPGRMIMIREFVQIAFWRDQQSTPGNTPSRNASPPDDTSRLYQVTGVLSPLFAASVLTLETSMAVSMLFMESLWRECWAEMTTWDDREFFGGLQWLTEALDLFLLGLPSHSNYSNSNHHQGRQNQQQPTTLYHPMESLTSSKELAMRWLLQLVELAAFLTQNASAHGAPVDIRMATGLYHWLSMVAARSLPRLFAILPSYQIALEPILWQILHVLEQLAEDYDIRKQEGNSQAVSAIEKALIHAFDTVVILRLSSVALSHPLPSDVQVVLRILHLILDLKAGASTVAEAAILRGLANMLLGNPSCRPFCRAILATLHEKQRGLPKSKNDQHKRSALQKIRPSRSSHFGDAENLIQFLDESVVDVNSFVPFLVKENMFVGTVCSPTQQTGSLLLCTSLMLEPSLNKQAAYSLVTHLLEVYPHLSISVLPVMIDCINLACREGDGATLQHQLDFLCTSMVKDAQCAREIWNLLGVELMKETTPSVIRATVLRVFPKLCIANKRLYKRVIEVLGKNLADSPNSWEIRLAVAVTIADLAKEDRIRDVTDVIGWIQGFITGTGWIRSVSNVDKDHSPGNAVLVHYAILALHYLLVAEELDFNLVIVVLNKRLCNVHDMKEVTKLPLLVLETLAQLLGDGETADDSDGDDKDDRLEPTVVSPQVSKSVEALLSMSMSPILSPQRATKDEIKLSTLLRCRANILDSLARYSMDSLGIDDDGLQSFLAQIENEEESPALPPSGEKYETVKKVLGNSIGLLESGLYQLVHKGTTKITNKANVQTANHLHLSLMALISNFLKFEEKVLGSSLWQKRGRKKNVSGGKIFVQGQTVAHSTQIAALPSTVSVQNAYNDRRCEATAIAVLLAYEGKPMSMFSDLAGDISHDSSDPSQQAFVVQAWLNAARSVLMELVVSFSSSEGLENVLVEIREWRFRLDSPDNMYLALASFALLIPDILGPYGDHSQYVLEICDEVWDGYAEQEFEDQDSARVCLGLIGVCAVRDRSNSRLEDIVDALEQSVSGYGGQATFGAYYSLGIIAQACPLFFEPLGGGSDDSGMIGRIIGFLVNELTQCISGNHSAITSLIDCIQEGEISPETIDTITAMGKEPLKISKMKKRVAKALFISLALSFPALTAVNSELLLGVYCLLEAIPWGYGKGMALSSVLQACKRSGLFQPREIEKIYSKYAKIFEEGMDQGVADLDDIFYAVTATMSKTIPYSIRRFLVGNRALFDEEGRAVSLLSAVVSLCSIPCLGCGALSFTDSPQLSNNATPDDIEGVVSLISEAVSSHEWTQYSEVGAVLMGFLASMNNFSDVGDASTHTRSSQVDTSGMADSKLPKAREGTILEMVMLTLSKVVVDSSTDNDTKDTNVLVHLLGCLEVLSLPGHFASTLEQLFRGNDETKTACTKLLISQIRGRPRAVFDGREYVELAVKMTKMPVATIKTILGQGDAPIIFINALVDLIPKFSTDAVAEVVEMFWLLSFNQIGNLPRMPVAFLSAIKTIVRNGENDNSLKISPKTLNFIRKFLVTRVFAGIRDAPWATSTTSSTIEERSIVESYANSLLELPLNTLTEAEFFTVKKLDGFVGEALRHRCVMVLVKKQYFTNTSRSSSEIASAIAWFSRQLTSSEEEMFSSTLLQVASSIADATATENSDMRREHLLTLLDNLLLTGASASFVGLQMLGVLVCKWTNGSGSDGDMSLLSLVATQMERWKELSPPTLQQTFRLVVHDLPFNLATYARREKISAVVFNRLWRIYNKWFDQGADQETINCVRRALVCCRSVDGGREDFTSLATSMLM